MHSRCCFCRGLLAGVSSGVWDTVLLETENHVVVPTKGALVPGWLLVVSKQHYICAGALPTEDLRDLGVAVNKARTTIEREFGPATVFEHGPAMAGTALGCGIDHCHIHVAPLPFSLRDAVEGLATDTDWQSASGLDALTELHGRGIGYAYVEENDGHAVWCRPSGQIRQMLRQAIANALGIGERYDYSMHSFPRNVEETVKRLSIGL